MSDECLVCRFASDPDAPIRDRLLRTDHWRAAHAFDAGLPGWLVLAPLAHVTALDELDPAAAAELGPLLAALTRALKRVTGCARTYVALFAEKEGFAHLHLHVVPRAPDLAPQLHGPGIFALLGVPEDERVPLDEQDAIAVRLRAALKPWSEL